MLKTQKHNKKCHLPADCQNNYHKHNNPVISLKLLPLWILDKLKVTLTMIFKKIIFKN